MLVLLGAMTGVFVARDLLVFALFWDLMLIPVFLMLVAWAPEKSTATRVALPDLQPDGWTRAVARDRGLRHR